MSTVSASQLRPNEIIVVRGKVSFSRLARVIEGEALAERIKNSKSQYPTTVPHTTISLSDAQVIPANPAAPTPEEIYVSEKFYTIKSGDNAGKIGFGLDNKGTFLPIVLEQDPDNPGQYRQLVLPQDLATGVDVTLVLNVFASGYSNKGIGIQQVVLNEPVRYYASGIDTNQLAARGIVVNGPIAPVASADSPAAQAPTAPADASTVINGDGLPMPGVLTAPAQPVAPAAQPAFAQPVAPTAAPSNSDAHIAQLQQQLAEAQAAAAGAGGESAFAAPAAPAAAPQLGDVPSPWGQGQ